MQFRPARHVAGLALVLVACDGGGDATPSAPATSSMPSATPAAASAAAPAATSAKPAAAPAPVASSASAAPPAASVAAPTSAAPAVAAPDPTVDCDALLSAADINAACGVSVEKAADPTDDIGPDRTCSRRFQSREAGALNFLIILHASADEAGAAFKAAGQEPAALPDFKALTGVGDAARHYTKKGASGDPVLTVDALKGRFTVALFNSKVTLGGETIGPVCSLDKLERLATAMIGKLP